MIHGHYHWYVHFDLCPEDREHILNISAATKAGRTFGWSQSYSHTHIKMSDIKLTYFYGKGRAEISRLILAFAGVKYEDNRIIGWFSRVYFLIIHIILITLKGEEFAAMKPFLSYGQVPRLEYKGQVIYQSRSIAR